MVLIPGGAFTMGQDGIAVPEHTVAGRAFYLDKFEVTKALWDDVKAYADANGYTLTVNSGAGVFHPLYSIKRKQSHES